MRPSRLSVFSLLLACGGDSTLAPPGQDGGGSDTGGQDVMAIADASADGFVPRPAPTCTPPASAPDTSKPTTVVGTGAGTCNEAALAAAIAKAGIVTFDCGGAATITITKTLALRTDVDTIIDGGGQVTLDGGNAVQILSFNHLDYRKNDIQLTLIGLTLSHGKVSGKVAYASAPAPCSQGYYDGYGGALFMRDGVLSVFNTTFDGNGAEQLGPDVGGGALSLQGVKKATIIGSTFKNGVASNGGAIESLNSDFDVYNTVFSNNVATGNGANSDDASKCSVVATDGQHQVGSGGNGGAIAIDGGSDLTHTFCGATFTGNRAGSGAFAGAIGRTSDLAKQKTILDRCVFEGNETPAGGGGALYFHNSDLQILGSTFHANSAKGCGAIQADGTTIDFLNDTFEANAATGPGAVGGGLCLFGVDGKMKNVTFANGKADGFGAAVFGGPTLTVDNSLFVNNTANNPGAPMQCQMTATGTGNLQFPQNHTSGGSPDSLCVTGIAFADPTLGAIAANGGPTATMLPKASSPALGIGKLCPATDQRGTSRPADGCTSGAVEGTK
jgi:hypothetical protein